ncbi:hypothetical protein CTA2_12945 [Colletotrichum tanaceti]|uniref:Arrestin-like N-terminal domain-containing protein n=1 Tax=Colletotrichum tanaceti TaxID=1306861 RepID=A0A4U6XMV1_9PEZI|nr:hypothetical protein CTA2_12945 [Colletotrichum tanaceti]TKW57020.1 hypothetical protein CTA1_5264 [Colletotrichum tanaceti]
MPQSETKQSPDLSIRLLSPQTPLFGGSLVRGHVVRDAHIVAASATVRVRLLGRAKAKLVVDRGNNSKSYYRSRFAFWPASAVAAVVHRGPVHVEPGGRVAWSFALPLPVHTDAASVNACGGSGSSSSAKEACFLRPGGIRSGPGAGASGTGGLGIPEQPLPGSTFLDGRGFSKKWHGFVEYWIEAELTVDGKSSVTKAVLPVQVLSPPTPGPPVTDFGLRARDARGCVSSQRLLPGMEEAELSFKQKTQKFFHSSKVPTFHFAVDVRCPTVIQMGSRATVPFLLHVTPDRDRTAEVVRDAPPAVTIKSLELELRSTSAVICPGTFEPHEASKTRKMNVARVNGPYYQAAAAAAAGGGHIVLPSGPKEEPLDLGAVLGLRVDALGRVLHGASLWRPSIWVTVLPTFVTYCVKMEHELHWDLRLSVAGETWACEGSQKVLILAPGEGMGGGVAEAAAMAAAASSSSAAAAAAAAVKEEEVPAYDGPGEMAPAYEKVTGGKEDMPSAGEKS